MLKTRKYHINIYVLGSVIRNSKCAPDDTFYGIKIDSVFISLFSFSQKNNICNIFDKMISTY